MGQLVKAGLLLPLDNYAEAYGWSDRVSENVLAVSSWSPDGKQFGTGQPVRLHDHGRDRRRLLQQDRCSPTSGSRSRPRSRSSSTRSRPRSRPARCRSSSGTTTRSPGIHEFAVIQDQIGAGELPDRLHLRAPGQRSSRSTRRRTCKRRPPCRTGRRRATSRRGSAAAATTTPSPNFAKGEGLFMITGNWIVENLGADSRDFGFFVMPPMEAGGPPVATGGAGFPLSIAAGTEHPDAAAAYIDWMTSDHAERPAAADGADPAAHGRHDAPRSSPARCSRTWWARPRPRRRATASSPTWTGRRPPSTTRSPPRSRS